LGEGKFPLQSFSFFFFNIRKKQRSEMGMEFEGNVARFRGKNRGKFEEILGNEIEDVE
jgi:hypothetical protein